MGLSSSQIKTFQKEILDWYRVHQRDLPWRHPSLKLRDGWRDPYKILVSEVMLQQTQVSRVIPKYEAWFKAFPSLKVLAKASTRDVLLHWSGLGYNRRALYLQKFAQTIVHEFGNRIPQDEKLLRSLPGIGEYTARALLCFAFDHQVAVVDTNVRKVIAVTFFNGELPAEQVMQDVATQLLPKNRAYAWNQALMDYSAAMLRGHKIAIPKQSKFKGSDRFFRGQIVKRLLAHHAQTEEELLEFFPGVTKERLEKILFQLQKEGILVGDKKNIMLPK